VAFRHRAIGRVTFRDVTFGYGGGRKRPGSGELRDFARSRIAIVGASGAGKTTVASLLVLFYDPNAGSSRLDDVDIRSLSLSSLAARQIAFVLQEPVLFGTTVRENIAYGRPDATDDEIVAAATAAGAHDFIQVLPDGYDFQIGERGVFLSGGQRHAWPLRARS
jgi:ABC-type multidrug transport system fused ATPase/permease subunit